MSVEAISNTIEKKTGLDINHDGFVGGVKNAEKQFGVDMNGDGYVGSEGECLRLSVAMFDYAFIYHRVGIQSKVERASHVDLNNDGIIGRPLDTYPSGYAGPY